MRKTYFFVGNGYVLMELGPQYLLALRLGRELGRCEPRKADGDR